MKLAQTLSVNNGLFHFNNHIVIALSTLFSTRSIFGAFFTQFIPADAKIVKVYIKDKLFIKGLKEYAHIICKQENLVTFERLKNLQAILPDDLLMRVHKSYIINTSKVKSIKGNQLAIAGHTVPISRGKKEKVKRRVF